MPNTNSENKQMTLLMASPKHYAVPEPDKKSGHANKFAVQGYKAYKKDPEAFCSQAVRQWTALREIFKELGVNVIVLPAIPDNPDLVFTADPSLSFKPAKGNLVTIFSHFSNVARQVEINAHADFFEGAYDRTLARSYHRFEGTGDNLYDSFRDVFWSGYTKVAGRDGAASGRSEKNAHRLLSDLTGVEVIGLEVEAPFFHIDTSMAPLPGGHIVCYPGGMKPDAYEKLLVNAFDRFGLDRDEYLIEVSEDDANKFACNLRCVGNSIVMSTCSQELQNRIKRKGYEVITTDMSSLIHSGGSVHCVTNNIYESRIPGGLIAQQHKLAV